MTEPDERPDPDALLRLVQAEASRRRRGKLTIFFGFAPGVGKTYRMLTVARERILEQRGDVVVGIVETHGRSETASLVLGLELLPQRAVAYRGRVLHELDLDKALARRPEWLLVDELAHTNAPGSRHPKRWQDVEELLAAGIHVLTTLNVQHLESLNDVIAQITGVRVRETVPDAVVEEADAIELVDVAPEVLLQRLHDGKIYLPDAARRAADHFFRRGNLLALRELALRRTAQHVDEDVRAFRSEAGVSATWPAGERILVCVGPAPTSDRLIRATARMAAGLRCPWVAVYAAPSSPSSTLRVDAASDDDRDRLEAHLRLAESLGAGVARLEGASVSEAILRYARRHNVTRIVIGKPTHARLRDVLRGSLLDDVVRGSGDIDVHVISGDAPPDTPTTAMPPSSTARTASLRSYLGGVVVVAVAFGVAAGLRAAFGPPDLVMVFLLGVMLTAAAFGRGPALLSAGVSVALYDFFFVPPLHTFTVDDRKYLLTFAMMFGVGIAISELVGRLRRQERDALGREERTAVLYALARDLAAADELTAAAQVAANHAAASFDARVSVLAFDASGAARQLGSSPGEVPLEPSDLAVAKWSHEHDRVAGLGTDTLVGARVMCTPLCIGESRLGVLALVPEGAQALSAEQRAFLASFCKQTATTLERLRLSEAARGAAVRARTEEIRASLLSAVSHDLRTPLATITGAATAVRDEELPDETRKELVESIVGEASRLERLVSNLLDMTRLEAGGIRLQRDWVPLDEIVSSALTRLEERLEQRSVAVHLPDDLPLLFVDPVLFEQLVVNLLENADKYTPKAAPLEVRATSEAGRITIEVVDHGPGIPQGAEAMIFEKFYRGPHAGVPGAGLGLSICRAIAEVHGATIVAENKSPPAKGAVFRVSLPRPDASPPSVSAEPDAGAIDRDRDSDSDSDDGPPDAPEEGHPA